MLNSKNGGRPLAAAAVASVLTVTAAACGSGGTGDGTAATASASASAAAEKVTITVQTFGSGENFGYDSAVEAWNKSHPNIQIKYDNLAGNFESEYLPQVNQWLEAGSGAGDIIGIDESGMGQMAARPQHFVDLAQYGLDSRKADFPEWKWNTGLNKDGKLFALGTDVGGMAMCYRSDLFKKAGLPTDREEVAKLWPDWDSYLKVGQQLKSKLPKTSFVDGPVTIFNTLMVQEAGKAGNLTFFDKEQNLVIESNPAVKTAFDFTKKLSEAGLSAKLAAWTDEWAAGQKNGAFATMACPSWMLGVISGNAGEENAGKWDVAAVPGGAGNWGGSWLAVTSQSKHPKEAAEVLNYLTSKEGQLHAFKEAGGVPSTLTGQQDPVVADAVNEYFSKAPSGKIFAESTQSVSPIFFGEKHTQVRAAVEQVLLGADQGSVKWGEAWAKFVAEGQMAAG
ncbi:ABC transporter substrate-binding protein [Nonomuraea africana]|uniref:Cellobiose transport system substrate-binding protein n=1 Tax=Nonomuraea africana TaxID=46171 RepID=A0ABR9KGB4_9ACTN|nr:ABC transporter substrate-binding protein [Nonomuraea africana]MBE1561062.1 cellobiose transport system substrate-binding protein [Nonomuraea africana]